MAKIEFVVFWIVEPRSVVVGYHLYYLQNADIQSPHYTAQQPRKQWIP